jgi:hypothetical protein
MTLMNISQVTFGVGGSVFAKNIRLPSLSHASILTHLGYRDLPSPQVDSIGTIKFNGTTCVVVKIAQRVEWTYVTHVFVQNAD